MALNFPKPLRRTFDVRNDERARAVTEALQEIARGALPASGAPGAPGTVPLIPSAKQLTIVTVTSTPHAMGNEDVLLVDDDTVGGDVTIDLQAIADTYGYPRWIKKLGTTGKVIIDPDGAETIEGLATVEIIMPKAALCIIPAGTNWNII